MNKSTLSIRPASDLLRVVGRQGTAAHVDILGAGLGTFASTTQALLRVPGQADLPPSQGQGMNLRSLLGDNSRELTVGTNRMAMCLGAFPQVATRAGRTPEVLYAHCVTEGNLVVLLEAGVHGQSRFLQGRLVSRSVQGEIADRFFKWLDREIGKCQHGDARWLYLHQNYDEVLAARQKWLGFRQAQLAKNEALLSRRTGLISGYEADLNVIQVMHDLALDREAPAQDEAEAAARYRQQQEQAQKAAEQAFTDAAKPPAKKGGKPKGKKGAKVPPPAPGTLH